MRQHCGVLAVAHILPVGARFIAPAEGQLTAADNVRGQCRVGFSPRVSLVDEPPVPHSKKGAKLSYYSRSAAIEASVLRSLVVSVMCPKRS